MSNESVIYKSFHKSVITLVCELSETSYVFGTGFFVTQKGDFITAYHNICKVKNIFAYCEGKLVKAKMIREDIRADIALLKIDLPHGYNSKCLSFDTGASTGDKCYVIGSCADMPSLMCTTGTIISKNCVLGTTIDSLLCSIKIVKGLSGSPILNESGYCIGIMSWFLERANASGGVGLRILKESVKRLLGNDEYRKYTLGMTLRPLLLQDILANNLLTKIDDFHGELVGEMVGYIGAIKSKDILLEINGEKVGAEYVSSEMLCYFPLKKKVVVKYLSYEGKFWSEPKYCDVQLQRAPEELNRFIIGKAICKYVL